MVPTVVLPLVLTVGADTPRLTPELAGRCVETADHAALERATVVYVLGRKPIGLVRSFRLDVVDLSAVRSLAREFEEKVPADGGEDGEFPYAVLFGGNREEGGPLAGFYYQPNGLAKCGERGRVYRLPAAFSARLDPLIEDRLRLLDAREAVFTAFQRRDWPAVEQRSSGELMARLRGELVPELDAAGVDWTSWRVVQWRETYGSRSRSQRRRSWRQERSSAIRAFVARVKVGDRGPSWTVHVLLDRVDGTWRVEDLKVRSSGSRGLGSGRSGR